MRKHNQQETTYVTMTGEGRASNNQLETIYVRRHEKGCVGNIAETKERRSRPASSQEISLPERYDRARYLGVEDDCGCGSGDDGKP